MKKLIIVCLISLSGHLFFPSAGITGKGYMGGKGDQPSEEPDSGSGGGGGSTGTGGGHSTDQVSNSGKLYGDLYKILRQLGGDRRLVPQVDQSGAPVISASPNDDFPNGIQRLVETDPAQVIGGEPVLTVINPETSNDFSDYGWYAAESISPTGQLISMPAKAPYPALCPQPVADYERWGDISSKTGLSRNRLPLVITYDVNWQRSECEVGQLEGVTVDPDTGDLLLQVNNYFILPCPSDGLGNLLPDTTCKWEDPVNGVVTYPNGVLWSKLVDEVHFGRLNMARAPEVVLQAAFDEAITAINDPDTIGITIDEAGRLLLTKNMYDEHLVDPATGQQKFIKQIQKAIDSPRENLALYVKLMRDGHLVTPADQRSQADHSQKGGTPLWKTLEMEDGPADGALRPTIDIAKMKGQLLESLVDVTPVEYRTYNQCVDGNGQFTPCLCWSENPIQPELDRVLVTCDNVVSRELFSTTGSCPSGLNIDNPIVCEGPFTGILTDGNSTPNAADLNFAAAFLAAAADKTGDIDVDMVVYINSILGINKVSGYSAYKADGTPETGATDYRKMPDYFDFKEVRGYDRNATFGKRGSGGFVTLLQGESPSWTETSKEIVQAQMDGTTIFHNIGHAAGTGLPDRSIATDNILGFSQQADDNLSVIYFTHTYQIPGQR